ncbi:hypothetical protein DV735_g4720, partial [Chaetothyriales sp. CBS 134920]
MSLIHLVHRSLNGPAFAVGVGGNHGTNRGPGGDTPSPPPLRLLVLLLTSMGFFLLLFGINYTYGHLLPTLCMIESPETAAYLPVDSLGPSEDEAAAPPAYEEAEAEDETDAAPTAGAPKPDDVELHLMRNKPVTASLRASIQHLQRRGGYWARYRGLKLYMLWNIAVGIITSMLSPLFGYNRIYVGLSVILAQIAAATIHMTWIHVVISEPSPRRWYRRIPSFRTWPKIAPAVALWALATQIVAVLPVLVCGSFGSLRHMKDPEYNPGKRDLYAIAAQGFFGMLLVLILYILLQIPATVAMVRVAASMLPDEDETIVSFDRTFGGKTTPAIVGGSGKIGIAEAWRSFPWASRVRLLKLVGKVALIVLAVWLAMLLTLTIEAHVLLGESLGEVLKGIHGVAGPR